MNKHSILPRIIALLLIITIIIPLNANAAMPETLQTYSSLYISSCSAYIEPLSGGMIRVHYSVYGTDIMDSIGALTVTISQSTDNVNWSVYKVFSYSSTSGMIGYSTDHHSSSVACQGVPGRYYTASVYIVGKKDGGSDTRYYYTNTVRAAINPS